jgi:hypothetical protein
MNQYDARQQFLEGLDRYVSGIETEDGLQQLASNVRAYHDRLPVDAIGMVSTIVWPLRRFTNSYAGAAEVLQERFRSRRIQTTIVKGSES